MPVRSLRSSVLKWPDRTAVDCAVREWAHAAARGRPEVVRIGYFGSYARGDWGVGSDVDLVVLVDRAEEPFARRAATWDTTRLPVPADLLVYTSEEWEGIRQRGFGRGIAGGVVWVYPAPNKNNLQPVCFAL